MDITKIVVNTKIKLSQSYKIRKYLNTGTDSESESCMRNQYAEYQFSYAFNRIASKKRVQFPASRSICMMSKSSIYLQKAKKEITSWLIGGHGAIPELRIYHEP